MEFFVEMFYEIKIHYRLKSIDLKYVMLFTIGYNFIFFNYFLVKLVHIL